MHQSAHKVASVYHAYNQGLQLSQALFQLLVLTRLLTNPASINMA